jgi:hypothetical protein
MGCTGFESQSALAGSGAEFVDGEALVDPLGAAEAVEAGGGEDEGVAFASGEFAQTGVDVAANLDEGDVRTEGEQLRPAARAGGADAATRRQGVQRPVTLADPGVAGVDTRRNGGEHEAGIEFGGEILERVHGKVDAAIGERFFNLLDEDALAIGERRERGQAADIRAGTARIRLLHPVAGGADDLDLDGVACIAERGGDVVRLPESELGASRADADGLSHWSL